MTVAIPLSQGQVALVDDEDADLATLTWSAARHGKLFYGSRHVYIDGKRTTQALHQVIGARKGIVGPVDHKDRDGLNNTRDNLRAATVSQNGANKAIQSNNTSGVKGVSWNKRDEKWQAKVQVKGRAQSCGTFDKMEDAEESVRAVRARIFGEYACHE